jgi:uncharacterized protein YggU (UPF0235/DUF167 family)
MSPVARIPLWVRPGSRSDGIEWDAWRARWVVHCRAPASKGAANRAVAALIADWLGLPPASVSWERAGTGRAKVLRAEGVTDDGAARRLRSRAAPPSTAPVRLP